MKLLQMKKVCEGKYLKQYELTYQNKKNREKQYEMISYNDLTKPEELGSAVNGVSIVATCQEKLLLLREFRMGVNREIYNLCAGMLEPGESIEECVARELYEETGLKIKKIKRILPPSFSSVAVSDIRVQVVFAEVEGEIFDHTSENEAICAAFYTKEEVLELIKKAEFSTRAQMAAYYFADALINP